MLISKVPHAIPYQGSKRALAQSIAKYLPEKIETMYEPFAGSAAMTIYAAQHNLAKRFVLGDCLPQIIELLEAIIEDPDTTARKYRNVWEGYDGEDLLYFNKIRDRYNQDRDPVDLLYIIARSVKNAVRFNRSGGYSQSQDKRRAGTKPERMRSEILAISALLKGRCEFRVGDWVETTGDAGVRDYVYMDPPYHGTSNGADLRYHSQLSRAGLIKGLEALNSRDVRYALSYDGTTGGREYAPPLPEYLGLRRVMLHAGRSSQATLQGRHEETVESLYLTEDHREPVRQFSRPHQQVALAF